MNENDAPKSDVHELMQELQARARPVYEALVSHGIRIFCVTIRQRPPHQDDLWYWVHPDKTVEQWRNDIREFMAASEYEDKGGWAESDAFNALGWHLRSLGYVEIDDIIADVYEGRCTNERSRIVDDPVHDEQADGFGHYGWENGRGIDQS